MEDLFENLYDKSGTAPLAERMRPQSLKEFLGQNHIAEEGSLLRRAISLDRLGSCIFWGPPGSGKTTLANIIANSTDGNFVKLNAVSSGVADVKRVTEQAKNDLKMFNKRTYLFNITFSRNIFFILYLIIHIVLLYISFGKLSYQIRH